MAPSATCSALVFGNDVVLLTIVSWIYVDSALVSSARAERDFPQALAILCSTCLHLHNHEELPAARALLPQARSVQVNAEGDTVEVLSMEDVFPFALAACVEELRVRAIERAEAIKNARVAKVMSRAAELLNLRRVLHNEAMWPDVEVELVSAQNWLAAAAGETIAHRYSTKSRVMRMVQERIDAEAARMRPDLMGR